MPFVEILGFARNNSLIANCLDKVVELCTEDKAKPGLAPFMRYVFLNPKELGNGLPESNLAPITPQTEGQLRCEYIVRKNDDAQELPYLHRYFPKGSVLPAPALCIAVVLYSREQCAKEGINIEADYGLVTAQAEPEWGISPMTPATILRNSMGTEFGGNGESIDRAYYMQAVAFWSKWAIVK